MCNNNINMRRVFRQIAKFSTENKDDVSQRQTGSLTSAQQKFSEVPIHLRPYDKEKYQVITHKIKKNSGYALLQIEPFPRARIMKACYHILQQLKIGLPENYIDRIYLEERTKYVMEITDKITDPEELEEAFGTDSIQIFILGLKQTLDAIPILRTLKSWENTATLDSTYLQDIKVERSQKFPIYKKGERPNVNFLT